MHVRAPTKNKRSVNGFYIFFGSQLFLSKYSIRLVMDLFLYMLQGFHCYDKLKNRRYKHKRSISTLLLSGPKDKSVFVGLKRDRLAGRVIARDIIAENGIIQGVDKFFIPSSIYLQLVRSWNISIVHGLILIFLSHHGGCIGPKAVSKVHIKMRDYDIDWIFRGVLNYNNKKDARTSCAFEHNQRDNRIRKRTRICTPSVPGSQGT